MNQTGLENMLCYITTLPYEIRRHITLMHHVRKKIQSEARRLRREKLDRRQYELAKTAEDMTDDDQWIGDVFLVWSYDGDAGFDGWKEYMKDLRKNAYEFYAATIRD